MQVSAYKTKLREECLILLRSLLKILDKLGVGSGGRYSEDPQVKKRFLEEGCPDWSYLYKTKPDTSNMHAVMNKNKLLEKNTYPEQLKDSLGACKMAEELIDSIPAKTSDGIQKGFGIKDQFTLEEILLVFPLQLENLSEALFGEKGDQLMRKAENGDREAMLKLIQLDKNLIHEEWSAKELRKAQLSGDDEYLKKLGKAISVDPLNPKKPYPKLRCFLVKGWDWGLNNLTTNEIFEYVKDLGLYGSDDPASLDSKGVRSFLDYNFTNYRQAEL